MVPPAKDAFMDKDCSADVFQTKTAKNVPPEGLWATN